MIRGGLDGLDGRLALGDLLVVDRIEGNSPRYDWRSML